MDVVIDKSDRESKKNEFASRDNRQFFSDCKHPPPPRRVLLVDTPPIALRFLDFYAFPKVKNRP